MLNTRNDYLLIMGIEVWRLRQPTTPVLTQQQPIVNYYLLNSRRNLVGLLLAEMNSGQQDQERELLLAIFHALEMIGKEINALIAGTTSPKNFLILLGANCPQISVGTETKVIMTYSLAEMLKNPLLKAKVWQSLSPLRIHE